MRPRRACILMIACLFALVTRCECELTTRTILVVHMENPLLPGNIAASSAIHEIIGTQPEVVVLDEYLDEHRPGNSFATSAAAMQHKYGRRQINLVLSVGPPALRFILQYGESLWPSVPKVFADVYGKPEQ